MPLIPKYETDAHGCLLCPLCEPADFPDDSDCSWRGLRAMWELAVPVALGVDEHDRKDAHLWSVSSHWRVECINGHVLATSFGDRDDADPFWLDRLPVMHLGTEIVQSTADQT